MNKYRTLLLFFLLSFLFSVTTSLTCGEEEIENCVKCGEGNKSNTCIQCKDKHFLFLDNLFAFHVMIRIMVKLLVLVIVMAQNILQLIISL